MNIIHCTATIFRHCGLVGSASAWDGTGCEFDSWQCRIYIPSSLSLRLLGSLRGFLGTYWLDTKIVLKYIFLYSIHYIQDSIMGTFRHFMSHDVWSLMLSQNGAYHVFLFFPMATADFFSG